MSGDMLRSLTESYQEVIEFTEESKKCSKTKDKKCGCKKCKKSKAAAAVRYLMPMRGLGYGYGRPGRDDDDKETNADNGAESGGGDVGGGDGGGMSEMHEFEIANIIVEKAYDVLDTFSVDEAIDVISAFLEMNGLEMRYSDLASMIVELDDWGSHPDAANNPELQRKARDRQREKANRERVQNIQSPEAKQREQQRQRDVNQRTSQRRQQSDRNAQKREQEKKRAAQSSGSSQSSSQSSAQSSSPGQQAKQKYKTSSYAQRVDASAYKQMRNRAQTDAKNFKRSMAAPRVGKKIGDALYDAPGKAVKASGDVIKGTAKAAAKGISKGIKQNNRDNAAANKASQSVKPGKIQGPNRISTRNTSRY